LGYLQSIKQRDSNIFIPMSVALAGDDVANRGAAFAMLKLRPVPGLSAAFMDYYIKDYINTAFAQVEYALQISDVDPQWSIGANIIDQRSVGSYLLTGSAFQAYQASAKIQIYYARWTAFAAGFVTGCGSHIYSPFGSKPNYTDMQQTSFDEAGEKAIGGSLAYDFGSEFTKFGLTGLSVGAWYTHGRGPSTRARDWQF